jgi:hypothetical protein
VIEFHQSDGHVQVIKNKERDEQIVLYRQAGMTLRRIGKKFDLHTSRIDAILRREERSRRWWASRGIPLAKVAPAQKSLNEELRGLEPWLMFLAQ